VERWERVSGKCRPLEEHRACAWLGESKVTNWFVKIKPFEFEGVPVAAEWPGGQLH
jgi:hypothetical protein